MTAQRPFTVTVQLSAEELDLRRWPLAEFLVEFSRLTARRAGVELVGDTWGRERRRSCRLADGPDGLAVLVECSPDDADVVIFELDWLVHGVAHS